MSTATHVPETSDVTAEELSADDARATLRRVGLRRVGRRRVGRRRLAIEQPGGGGRVAPVVGLITALVTPITSMGQVERAANRPVGGRTQG